MAIVDSDYFGPGNSAGTFLDYSTSLSNSSLNVSLGGGWHSPYYFSVHSIHFEVGVDWGAISSGDSYYIEGIASDYRKYFISGATRAYQRLHYDYGITLYAYIRCHLNGEYREQSAAVSVIVPKLNSWTISYNANGGSTTPASQTKWYGENLTLQGQISRNGYTFVGWNTKADGTGYSYAAEATYTANEGTTLYAKWELIVPNKPTITGASVSGNQATLTIQRGSNYETAAQSLLIYRQVNNGQFSLLDTVDKATTSYVDSRIISGYTYTYRAAYRAYDGSESAYSTSQTLYTNPKTPEKITLSRISTSDTSVLAELTNTSEIADSLEWEYTYDRAQWLTGGVVSGSPVTRFTATGISGIAWIRVRNKLSTTGAVSEWLVSDQIITRAAPNPPTLVDPINRKIVNLAGNSIRLSWLHNPLDGSAQSAAQVSVKNKRTNTTYNFTTTTAQFITITPSQVGALAGDEFEWTVKTKGADASYSQPSGAAAFLVYSQPQLNITSPASTVYGMPVELIAAYSDMQGFSCVGATVSLIKDGTTLFSEPCDVNGSSITASLDVGEFLPTTGETYTVEVRAESSSSLSCTSNTTFTTQFTPPNTCSLNISNNAETGICSFFVYEEDTGGEEVVSVSVARISPDGSRMQLLDRVAVGTSFVDRYAPLNTPYTYEVVSHSYEEGVTGNLVVNTIATNRWFAYFGDEIAWANASGDEGRVNLGNPEMALVQHVGQDYPNAYNTLARSETHGPSFKLVHKEQAGMFRRLVAMGGIGIYKSAHGDVFHAAFGVELAPYTNNAAYYGAISLSVTRISGEAL